MESSFEFFKHKLIEVSESEFKELVKNFDYLRVARGSVIEYSFKYGINREQIFGYETAAVEYWIDPKFFRMK